MTKIDIYSGFLGAGKTTLIKKMIQEAYKGEKLVLIENEFGEIGIDGGFLKEAGIEITEMNSGCICCSLVGDFGKALNQVLEQYNPDRIIIEPSGVGKLSDVIAAVKRVLRPGVELGSAVAVADATKCRMYMKNFGEFYNNQIETAQTIFLSRIDMVSEEKLHQAVEMIRTRNDHATIVTTPWQQLTGEQLRAAMEQENTLAQELEHLEHDHEHHHHEHDHDEHCGCGCHDHEHEHHHDHDHDHEHHHDHGPDCTCGCHDHDHDQEHHHEHEHDEHCDCGCHDHHHHHADEVFTSWGVETPKKFTKVGIAAMLAALEDESLYGFVLRAKGYVEGEDGQWIYFDYVPGDPDIRDGSPAVTGRLCVIGSKINEQALSTLFGV
ncbi:MAG TPA: GTP-binding protein [Candidatus Avoscillospira avistercoris]|uniref:GTP-binding protein n=1 Tax=Candidatus Avoscillospira avistercoris TaxID=2840707 RepID=A0A9D1F9S4_9FIRM|nr:GTP-binding protein [Candidatus Avoscillospira avistercoris]